MSDGLSWQLLKSGLESRCGYPIDRARIQISGESLSISFDAYGRHPETKTTRITESEKAILAGLVRKVEQAYRPDSLDGIDCRISWLSGRVSTRIYFTKDGKKLYHDEESKC